MHFTDEFMDQWAEDLDRDRQATCLHRETTLVQLDEERVQVECDACGLRLGAPYVY